jgi:hypothetical protein
MKKVALITGASSGNVPLADARYQVAKNSDPAIIARLILKSIEARKPKTRYREGYMASAAIIGRKLLSDKMFDKIISSQMKA